MSTRIGRALRAWRGTRRETRARPYVFNYEHVLGTSLELRVIAENERDARVAEREALAEVDRLEPILSGWSASSELAAWLASTDVDVVVSPELADVLDAAETWRQRTRGAFDPAAQAIIDLLRGDVTEWRIRDTARALRDELSIPLWTVDRAGGTARRLTRRAVSLDAIAKGYIVARAATRAGHVAGVSSVLLNVGGDVQHVGCQPVLIGIADPFAPAENARPIDAVRVRGAALATSGGYRRGFVAGGRRVSHIIDPRTGHPAERIASASVIAPDCATADALATAFSVLEPAESVALADSIPGVGCFLVGADGAVTANDAWTAGRVAMQDHSSQPR